MDEHWNFECKTCPRYIRPNRPRHMGFCVIRNEKVRQTNTCRENPMHEAFLFFMFLGIPRERAIQLACIEGVEQ